MSSPPLPSRDSAPYYVVSMGKFTWLCLSAGGFFVLYWFYRNWYLIDIKRYPHQVATFRAIFVAFFSPLFVHYLFLAVRKTEEGKEQHYSWNPMGLGWVFIAANIGNLLMAYRNAHNEPDWFGVLMTYPVLLTIYYVLYKVQLVCNRISGDPFGRVNSKFTELNVFVIVMGIVSQCMTIYMLYLKGVDGGVATP